MWEEQFNFIKDQYQNLSISKSNILSQLNDLVTKDNIDFIWSELPAELKQVVHLYSLGATSKSFCARRWNNMWRFLISEDFHIEELITHNTSNLTVRFPANHHFIVQRKTLVKLKLEHVKQFPDELDITIKKGTLLAPVDDFMVSDEKINCIPVNYKKFRDQNLPVDFLSMDLLDSFYLIIEAKDVIKNCIAIFNSIEINPN